MGFIDKLINAIGKLTGSKGKNVSNKASVQQPKAESRVSAEPQRAAKPAPVNTRSRAELAAEAELTINLREILASEYPQYEIQENADVKMIDESQEFGGPVNFLLLSGGKAVGAVMILDQGKKRTKRIHGVELACKNAGAGYANFYTHFNENEDFPFTREYAAAYLKRQIQ